MNNISLAMTTSEIESKGLTESETCSCRCKQCKARLWHLGMWGSIFIDEREMSLPTAPYVFACPLCGRINVNPFLLLDIDRI